MLKALGYLHNYHCTADRATWILLFKYNINMKHSEGTTWTSTCILIHYVWYKCSRLTRGKAVLGWKLWRECIYIPKKKKKRKNKSLLVPSTWFTLQERGNFEKECGIQSAATWVESLQYSPHKSPGNNFKKSRLYIFCLRSSIFTSGWTTLSSSARGSETGASTRGFLLNVVMTGVRLTLLGV